MKKSLKILFFAVLIILITIFGFYIFVIFGFDDLVREKQITKDFYGELKEGSAMHMQINSFGFGEHAIAYGDITLLGKGRVSFSGYNKGSYFGIGSIGNFKPRFHCKIDSGESWQALNIEKDGIGEDWFPFEVTTLHQLAEHYDEIVSILSHLPSKEVQSKSHPNCTLITGKMN